MIYVFFIFLDLLPFLRKWTRVPDDYETLYHQLVEDMRKPDFVAHWKFLTVWGYKSLS